MLVDCESDLIRGGTGSAVCVHWGRMAGVASVLGERSQNTVAIIDGNLRGHHQLDGIPASHQIFIDGSERCKTRQVKADLEDRLLPLVDHRSFLVAVGGGALLDLVGFTAATLLRGLAFISVPTTLLAMVDACYGGKNGLNTPLGKNLIGSIYDPKHIWCDPSWLTPLSQHQLSQGLAEMIKHACIGHHSHLQELKAGDNAVSLQQIRESLQVKFRVVQASLERPQQRHLLNFGHTVGHALEGLSGGAIPHGSAVAIGLIIESTIAKNRGWISQQQLHQLINVIEACGLPTSVACSAQDVLLWAGFDKKNVRGHIFCTLPTGPWGLAACNTYDGPQHVTTAELVNAWASI